MEQLIKIDLKKIPQWERHGMLNNLFKEEGLNTENFNTIISIDNEGIFVYWLSSIKDKCVMGYNKRTKEFNKISFPMEQDHLNFLKKLEILANKKGYYHKIDEERKSLKIYIDSIYKPDKIKSLTKGKTTISLNTLLHTSWGYDQTNVEMFRIIKFLGKNYFIIQEITQKTSDYSSHGMACSTEAGTEDLNKLPIKAYISNDGYMSICENGYKRSLYINEEGKKYYTSWYH